MLKKAIFFASLLCLAFCSIDNASTAAGVNVISGQRDQQPRTFSWQCISKGHTYKPNANTTCVCVAIFNAECKPNEESSTTSTTGYGSTTTTKYSPTTTTNGYNSPTTTNGYNSPTTTNGYNSPTTTNGYNSPTTTNGYSSPTTTNGYNSPTTTNGYNSPTTTNGYNSPTTTSDYGSSTSTGDNPSSTTTPQADRHPLDPLTAEEIKRTSNIISSKKADSRFIFNWITLKEPPKSVLLPYFLDDKTPPENVYPRKSFSILIERMTGKGYEAVVDLSANELESLTEIANDLKPSLSPEDLLNSEAIVRADPEVRERCSQLGYPNISLVNADPWSMGYVGDKPQYQGKRLIQLYLYGKNFEDDNQYAHPFDFIVIVDVIKKIVIGIEELPTHDDFDASNKMGNVVPRTPDNYDYRLRPSNFLRRDDKPIIVSSPQGPSYRVYGNEIQWQKFKLRLGFNGREGLVIYNVNYNDNGQVRPLIYRTALSEMFIPYGDPRPPYHRKAVFDLGEYGIGFNANELKPDRDCIGEVKYFDGILNNSTGDPKMYKNAICVREEDAGILWKHVDYRTGKAVVVRSHRLVLSFIATVGNYEYIFLWQFYQDASIQLQIQLTGILSINLLAINATTGGYGSIEFPQLNAPYHQHFFSVRMDTEIDGNLNSAYISEAVSVEGDTGSPTNPYGQGFTTKKTELKTASEARAKTSAETGRVWVVTNPNNLHPVTHKPVGWKLMPMNTPGLLMKEDSPLRPKAAFLDYDVWVTPYQENQFFAGGFYLNNSGLPEWVGKNPNASVENTDIVLWHNFGLTHIPRVEDFPVMPVELTGFWLKPFNFFLENPGLDVPPPTASSSKHRSEL